MIGSSSSTFCLCHMTTGKASLTNGNGTINGQHSHSAAPPVPMLLENSGYKSDDGTSESEYEGGLSVCLSVRPAGRPDVRTSGRLSFQLAGYQFVICLSVRFSVCLSVCLGDCSIILVRRLPLSCARHRWYGAKKEMMLHYIMKGRK